MLYRLIPTLGINHARTEVETLDPRQLQHFAEAFAGELGMRVLVCEAPEGGLVRQLYSVGQNPETTKGRRRRA